jgi:hypothetical protein
VARIGTNSGIFEVLREFAAPRVRLGLFGAATLNRLMDMPADSRAPAHALLAAINDPTALAQAFGPRDGFVATGQGQASLFAFETSTFVVFLASNPSGAVEWNACEKSEVALALRLREHDADRKFAHIYPNPGELRLRSDSTISLEIAGFLASFCESAMRGSPKLRAACDALLPNIEANLQREEISENLAAAPACAAKARL